LHEDGSLDEVFDSLSTGRSHPYRPHLIATPPPGSVASLTHAQLLEEPSGVRKIAFVFFKPLLVAARSSAPHAGTSPGVSAIADPGLVW
jgi:hypothetical protein